MATPSKSFSKALDKLLIESPKITPYATPCIGFAGDIVIFKGTITLHVTLGKVLYCMIDFLIVDHLGTILFWVGRSYYQLNQWYPCITYPMKIPVAQKVFIIEEDQQSA